MRKHVVNVLLAVGIIGIIPSNVFAQRTAFGLSATPSRVQEAIQVAKARKGGAQAKALNGNFTFNLHGAGVGLSPAAEVVAVGVVSLDGKGKVVDGEVDFDSANGASGKLHTSGTYTLNADGTGSLVLVAGKLSAIFEIHAPAVGGRVNHAILLEEDVKAGLSGTLDRQTFKESPVGNYAFTLTGETLETSSAPNAVAIAGNFTFVDGNLIGSAGFFVNNSQRGTAIVVLNIPFITTVTSPDAFGRFVITLAMTPSADGKQIPPLQVAGYVTSDHQFNLIPIDSPSDIVPILSGSAVQ